MALCMVDQHFRRIVLTTIQLGTCAMKPREEGGVVDARLNVYGTQNLKVAGMPPNSLLFDDMKLM
jgi:alcohol oxidase